MVWTKQIISIIPLSKETISPENETFSIFGNPLVKQVLHSQVIYINAMV